MAINLLSSVSAQSFSALNSKKQSVSKNFAVSLKMQNKQTNPISFKSLDNQQTQDIVCFSGKSDRIASERKTEKIPRGINPDSMCHGEMIDVLKKRFSSINDLKYFDFEHLMKTDEQARTCLLIMSEMDNDKKLSGCKFVQDNLATFINFAFDVPELASAKLGLLKKIANSKDLSDCKTFDKSFMFVISRTNNQVDIYILDKLLEKPELCRSKTILQDLSNSKLKPVIFEIFKDCPLKDYPLVNPDAKHKDGSINLTCCLPLEGKDNRINQRIYETLEEMYGSLSNNIYPCHTAHMERYHSVHHTHAEGSYPYDILPKLFNDKRFLNMDLENRVSLWTCIELFFNNNNQKHFINYLLDNHDLFEDKGFSKELPYIMMAISITHPKDDDNIPIKLLNYFIDKKLLKSNPKLLRASLTGIRTIGEYEEFKRKVYEMKKAGNIDNTREAADNIIYNTIIDDRIPYYNNKRNAIQHFVDTRIRLWNSTEQMNIDWIYFIANSVANKEILWDFPYLDPYSYRIFNDL